MTIGFGILGAGMISGLHADALRNSSKADLVAVCDMDADRAAKLAADYAPDATVYTSFDEMLADPRVQVINIVTPNHLHTRFVVAAAAAGKHVLCEKPPAMSLAETDQMLDACRAANVKFGIFVQCRLREPIQHMKKALESGRFGKILRADAIMKWYRATDYYKMDAWRSNRRAGAGVTVQHAFHYIDLLQYLMGPAQDVDARMSNLSHPDIAIEDCLDARIQFANGAIGTVAASTGLWPGSDVRIEVYGENGTAIMEGTAMSVWQFKDEKPEDAVIRSAGDADVATASNDPTALPSGDHQLVIDDCVDAIVADHEVAIPCSAVRPSLELALAMYKADKNGTKVTLPLQDEENIW